MADNVLTLPTTYVIIDGALPCVLRGGIGAEGIELLGDYVPGERMIVPTLCTVKPVFGGNHSETAVNVNVQ